MKCAKINWRCRFTLTKDFLLYKINIKILLFDTSIKYIIQVIPFIIIVILIYSCSKYLLKKENIWREPIKLIFVCYFIGLIALTCVPPNFWENVWSYIIFGQEEINIIEQMFTGSFNFLPLLYKIITGKQTGGLWIWTMFIGNMIMFIPLGLLLPFILKQKNFFQVIKIGTILIIFIEIVQPIFGRSFDVDDIICNILGTIIGYGIFVVIKTNFFK